MRSPYSSWAATCGMRTAVTFDDWHEAALIADWSRRAIPKISWSPTSAGLVQGQKSDSAAPGALRRESKCRSSGSPARCPTDSRVERYASRSALRWSHAIRRLRSAGLLAPPNPVAPDALDTHPLVRAYYRHRLRTQYPTAWRAGHRRLFTFLQASVASLPCNHRDIGPTLCRGGSRVSCRSRPGGPARLTASYSTRRPTV